MTPPIATVRKAYAPTRTAADLTKPSPRAASSRRVDVALAGAAVVLLAVAVLVGSPATGWAVLVVAMWAAGRALVGPLARPARSSNIAAVVVLAAVLAVWLLPESAALAAPLLVAGPAAGPSSERMTPWPIWQTWLPTLWSCRVLKASGSLLPPLRSNDEPLPRSSGSCSLPR